MTTFDVFDTSQAYVTGVAVGAGLGLLVGVPLGRWSLLLLWHSSWRRQYLRSLPRPVTPAVHAGRYVVPRSVSNGVETLADRQFRVR